MRKSIVTATGLRGAALAVTAVCGGCAHTTFNQVVHYSVTERINAPDGEYDYVSVDSVARRLYIGREDGVMRVDMESGEIRNVLLRKNVAAAILIPDKGLMLSTNGGSDTATLFDPNTGAVKADIATGHEPDSALYDVMSGMALVMNGGDGSATLIDVKAAKAVGTIVLGGKPEAAASDGRGNVYINIEDTNETVVFGIAKRDVLKRFSLGDCHEPTGIAYDAETELLIVACHNRMAKLVSATTGRIRGGFPIGAGADGSIFDPGRRIGFIPCIDGTLTIYRLSKKGEVNIIQVLPTADGARTAALDSKSGAIYLPAARVERDSQGGYLTAREGFSIIVAKPR